MSDDLAPPQSRSDYPHFLQIPTRWMDNDIYGHVNNVTYYSYFDTVINSYLIERGGLDIHRGTVIGITPEFTATFAIPSVFRRPSKPGWPWGVSAGAPSAT